MMKCPSPIAGMVWPARPLDDYLGELRAHGYTVVDGLISDSLGRCLRLTKLASTTIRVSRESALRGISC